MRLWSLHPHYLDAAGLVACWRESLLAQKVLQGATTGYRNHPQLERFREHPSCISQYLLALADEADARSYRFDRARVIETPAPAPAPRLTVTRGQLQYERRHLLAKLERRAPDLVAPLLDADEIRPHPLFVVVDGDVETWERVGDDDGRSSTSHPTPEEHP